MVVRRVRFGVSRYSSRLLVAVKQMMIEEKLHLVDDLARTQFAVAAPFVEESQEHAIWSKLVLLA